MVTRFALSVFAALVWIPPVSAGEIKGATMAEALEKIPSEHVKKDDDGLWSANEAIEIPNERSKHPKILTLSRSRLLRGAALRNQAVRVPA